MTPSAWRKAAPRASGASSGATSRSAAPSRKTTPSSPYVGFDAGGHYGNVIRFLMPLVITDEQLEKGLAIVEDGLATLKG